MSCGVHLEGTQPERTQANGTNTPFLTIKCMQMAPTYTVQQVARMQNGNMAQRSTSMHANGSNARCSTFEMHAGLRCENPRGCCQRWLRGALRGA